MICMHGFRETDCLTCHKEPGECDYGGCCAPAVVVVSMYQGRRLVEVRPACARHAKRSPMGVAFGFHKVAPL